MDVTIGPVLTVFSEDINTTNKKGVPRVKDLCVYYKDVLNFFFFSFEGLYLVLYWIYYYIIILYNY